MQAIVRGRRPIWEFKSEAKAMLGARHDLGESGRRLL